MLLQGIGENLNDPILLILSKRREERETYSTIGIGLSLRTITFTEAH